MTLLVAGCSKSAAAALSPAQRHALVPQVVPPVVSTSPSNAARNVAPSPPPRVTATNGTLTAVSLAGSDGSQIPGELTADRHEWTAEAPLHYGITDTWLGTAATPGGQLTPITDSFATATPARQVRAILNIGDGDTVGVAAPIILQFTGKVQNRPLRPALRRRLLRPARPDPALHHRPLANREFPDADSHHMVVIRDGQQVADYPASYGLDSSTDRTTRSGIHIVMERDHTERMTSQRYHYDVVEHWAVRISNNGEFIHANPASASAQGNSNVTHGCINLSTGDAQTYFGTALYGDPVEVTGTGVSLGADDGDIYDWVIPWNQWQAMSA